MTERIQAYLLSICAAAILVSVVQTLLPKGSAHRVAGFVGGLLIILTVISPVAELQPTQLAKSISRIQLNAEELETGIEIANRDLMADIIKGRCESYILDKAMELGMSIQVDVELDLKADYPYPVKVMLTGTYSVQQQEQLSLYISENLGVSRQQQEWSQE